MRYLYLLRISLTLLLVMISKSSVHAQPKGLIMMIHQSYCFLFKGGSPSSDPR